MKGFLVCSVLFFGAIAWLHSDIYPSILTIMCRDTEFEASNVKGRKHAQSNLFSDDGPLFPSGISICANSIAYWSRISPLLKHRLTSSRERSASLIRSVPDEQQKHRTSGWLQKMHDVSVLGIGCRTQGRGIPSGHWTAPGQ